MDAAPVKRVLTRTLGVRFIKNTYQVDRQPMETLSLPERKEFKHSGLLDYLKPWIWTSGVVTAKMEDYG